MFKIEKLLNFNFYKFRNLTNKFFMTFFMKNDIFLNKLLFMRLLF